MPSGHNDLTAQLLQLMYFVPAFRTGVQMHLSSSPKCLASEARLFFDAVQEAARVLPYDELVLPPDNVVRCVTQLKGASNMGFLHPTRVSPARRAHIFTQFAMSHVMDDVGARLKEAKG